MKNFNLTDSTVHNTSVNFHGAYHYHSNHASQRENRVYHRETIAALNNEIHQMSFLPFYATQIINPFLNSRSSANHDKVERLFVIW